MFQKIRLFFILLLLAGTLQAQVNLSAQADKTSLALDDELTFTVKVTGVSGNVVMPQLPSLPAFNVYSREVEQNTINGETTLLFRYIMLPRFVGNATIGAVTFVYKGETYKTEPITVQIYRNTTNQVKNLPSGDAQTDLQIDPNLPPLQATLTKLAYSQAGQPFFLIAAVSNKTPYVNEPVELAIRFYYSRAFHDAPYQKPNVSNLFMEDEGSSEGSQTINNTLYRYQEQRYQLTAAAPGTATIGPASVRYHTGSSALSAFDRIFGGSTAGPEKTALSSPITLTVRPLPTAERPGSFYGAVGSGFTLQAKAEPQEVRAGEAVNVSVTVKGPGNLKATQNLEFPPLDGFKIYPAATTSGITRTSGQVQGYKTFKAVFVPVSSGIYSLPRFTWSYFDPTTKTYRTLQTAPIQITVGAAAKSESGFNFADSNPMGNGVQTLTQDITYLKTASAPAENILARISRYPVVNWIGLFAVALIALFAALGRAPLAKKKAFLTAKNQLKKANSSQAVSDIISQYLQVKLHRATGSLSLKELNALLREQGVTPATAESFSLLWQRLEAERFAPAAIHTSSAVNLPTQALDILKLIEGEMK